jgi:hypothetical protein
MTNAEAEGTATAAAVAEDAAHVASDKAVLTKAARNTKNATKGQKPAKGGKPQPAAKPKKAAKATKKAAKREDKPAPPRATSKGATILDLIARPKGATLAEIVKATGWQAHSVRGFLSTAAKKHGMTIESVKNDAGERTYKSKK